MNGSVHIFCHNRGRGMRAENYVMRDLKDDINWGRKSKSL